MTFVLRLNLAQGFATVRGQLLINKTDPLIEFWIQRSFHFLCASLSLTYNPYLICPTNRPNIKRWIRWNKIPKVRFYMHSLDHCPTGLQGRRSIPWKLRWVYIWPYKAKGYLISFIVGYKFWIIFGSVVVSLKCQSFTFHYSTPVNPSNPQKCDKSLPHMTYAELIYRLHILRHCSANTCEFVTWVCVPMNFWLIFHVNIIFTCLHLCVTTLYFNYWLQ